MAAQVVLGILLSITHKTTTTTKTSFVSFAKATSVFIISVIMGSFSFSEYFQDQEVESPVALIGSSAGICGLNGMIIIDALSFLILLIWSCPDENALPSWRVAILALKVIVVIISLLNDLLFLVEDHNYISTVIVHMGGMFGGMVTTSLGSLVGEIAKIWYTKLGPIAPNHCKIVDIEKCKLMVITEDPRELS